MTTFCDRVVGDVLHFGCTNFAGDFLLALELATGNISSCGYPAIYEENEFKMHRGLWYDAADGSLVFTTSTLSPVSKLASAPGGKFVRYHIANRRFEILGNNERGQYAQASVYDAALGLLYFFGFRALKFGVFDVREQRIRHHIFVNSIPHVAALNDTGRCWGTWGFEHYWFCYDPEKDAFRFFDKSLATARQAANVMYEGAGPTDGMINGGDGFLYVSTALGELYRLDPETAETEYLGRPSTQQRLPGLAVGSGGLIYGVGGDSDVTYLVRYDRSLRRFEILGNVEAADGVKCYRPHDIFVHGNRIFIAETDAPHRSGFIWEVVLD